MKHLNKLILVLASASFFYASAQAQNAGTVTNNAFAIGKGPGVQGFGSVPCTAGQVPVGQSGAPQCKTLSGDISLGASGATAIVPGAANTFKGTLDGVTTGNITLTACSAVYQVTKWVSGTGWQCGTNPVLPSRSTASTLDLSAHSAIRTLGYATAGDGGGATFQKVSGSTAFIDSFISTYTIQGSSGCTNGSYFGVLWTKVGNPTYAIGTATASGGAVTAVSIAGTPGNAFSVGDVLTTSSVTGCSPTITVTAVSTPRASFTDSAGNRWQYVPDGFVNVKQFGAVGDWNGTDGSATDNFNAIQAASWFATYKSSTSFDSGGYWGGKVIFPSGSYMACGGGSTSLIVGEGVTFEGPNAAGGATIRACSTFSNAVHFIEICDPNWHFACFNSTLREISISGPSVGASGGAAMVHSNAVQDFGGLDHVYIYGGNKTCAWFEKGYGGASNVQIQYVSCSTASASPQIMIGNTVASGLAYGTTIILLRNIILGGPSSGGTYQTGPGMFIQGGGQIDVLGAHCEAMPQCIKVDIPAGGNANLVRLHNVNAGSGAPAPTCTGVIELAATNSPGNTIVGAVPAGSCTNVVTNGQSGGTNRTTTITTDVVFNP